MKRIYYRYLLLQVSLILFAFYANAQESKKLNFPDSTKVMNHLYILSADSMQGRKVETKGGQMARKYIIQQLQDQGIAAFVPGYTQKFTYKSRGKNPVERKAVNVLAYVEGFTHKEIIVLSAHYDHVGMEDSTIIYNGADDNASGTAALLELSRYFSENQPEYTLLFAFFDAEEEGLQGAKHFMQSVVVDSSLLKLNVNMDMIARGDKKEIYAVGTYFHPAMKPFIQEAARGKSLKVLFGRDDPKKQPNWVSSSDHAPFHKANIPFVYFGVDDHPDYHKPTDTADKIDPDFYLEAITMIKDAIENLDANLKDITIKK